jgi:hypothetical protein
MGPTVRRSSNDAVADPLVVVTEDVRLTALSP